MLSATESSIRLKQQVPYDTTFTTIKKKDFSLKKTGLGESAAGGPVKPQGGSRDNSGCAEADPLPDTRTAFTCWLVAAACHTLPGTAALGEARATELGGHRQPEATRGRKRASGAAAAPTLRRARAALSALQTSGVHGHRSGKLEVALLSPKPHFPSANFPRSSPQPVLPTTPCVAPSGTVKQQDLSRSVDRLLPVWTMAVPPTHQRSQLRYHPSSPNTPSLPWPGASRGGSGVSFLRFVQSGEGYHTPKHMKHTN